MMSSYYKTDINYSNEDSIRILQGKMLLQCEWMVQVADGVGVTWLKTPVLHLAVLKKRWQPAIPACLFKSRDIKLSIINYSFTEELIIIAFQGAGGCMSLPYWGLVIEMQFSIPILTQSRVEETAL